jgi:hypothetical protein
MTVVHDILRPLGRAQATNQESAVCDRKRNIMNVIHQAITTAFTAAVVGIFFVPAASACGPNQLQSPFAIQPVMLNAHNPLEAVTSESLARDLSNALSGNSPTIVGMWSFQFISMGNTTHSPSIPDGAQLDFGYNQWRACGRKPGPSHTSSTTLP